jgi:hypothetical protein
MGRSSRWLRESPFPLNLPVPLCRVAPVCESEWVSGCVCVCLCVCIGSNSRPACVRVRLGWLPLGSELSGGVARGEAILLSPGLNTDGTTHTKTHNPLSYHFFWPDLELSQLLLFSVLRHLGVVVELISQAYRCDLVKRNRASQHIAAARQWLRSPPPPQRRNGLVSSHSRRNRGGEQEPRLINIRFCSSYSLLFPPDRSQKSIGLLTGPPSYAPVSGFDREEADSSNQTRVFKYSPDGRWVAMGMENQ